MFEYDLIKSQLRVGDIVLFSGQKLHEMAIRDFTGSRWSHVEVIFPAYGHFFAIGAIGSGVRIERLGQKFIEHHGCAKIVRPHWESTAQAEKFIAALLFNLKGRYDFSGVFSFLVRKICPGFRWHTPNAQFCSELVAAGLVECGYAWTHKKPDEISPGEFDSQFCFSTVATINIKKTS